MTGRYLRRWCAPFLCGVLALGGALLPVQAAPLSRQQALRQLTSSVAPQRRAAIERLAIIGRMHDSEALAKLLFDGDPAARAAAEAALWKVWSRSGDVRIDQLYARGVREMNSGAAEDAVATFSEIIRLKPEFAEAWNKRATVLYFSGRLHESLADCAEVIKRNPHHFGALAGYGQIYSGLGNAEKALEYFAKALAINPNLHGVAANVQALRGLLSERQRKSI